MLGREKTHVTTLEHEGWDHSVEPRAGVTEPFLTGAESSEVLGGLGDYIVVELEGDSASGGAWGVSECSGGRRLGSEERKTELQPVEIV